LLREREREREGEREREREQKTAGRERERETDLEPKRPNPTLPEQSLRSGALAYLRLTGKTDYLTNQGRRALIGQK